MPRILPFILPLAFGCWAQAAGINLTDRIRLTDLGAGNLPTAINNVGVVVGKAANGVAYKWQGTLTSLGTLGGSQSYANDLNDSGVVVGWSLDSDGKQKSFSWDGAFTNLDETTSLQGAAESINNNGEIVG